MKKYLVLLAVFFPLSVWAGPFTVSSPDSASSKSVKIEAKWEHSDVEDTLEFPKVEFKTPVLNNLDFAVELPYETVTYAGGSSHSGFSDVEAKSKWHFYQSGPLGLAIEPEITLPTGSDGFSHDDVTATLPLIVGYETGAWEFGSELGYEHVFGQSENSAYWGALVERELAPGFKAGAEFVVESPDATWNQLVTWANVGIKWEFGEGYELEALAGHTVHTPASSSGVSQFKLELEKSF